MRLLASAAVLASLSAQPALAQDRLELAPSSNWNLQYDSESCALQRDFGDDDSKVFMELRAFDPAMITTWQVMIVSKDIAEKRKGPVVFGFDTEATSETSQVYNIALDGGYTGRLFDISVQSFAHSVFDPAKAEFRQSTPLLSEDERTLISEVTKIKNWSRLTDREDAAVRANYKADKLYLQSAQFEESLETWAASATAAYVEKGFAKPLVLQTGKMSAPMNALRDCLDSLLESWGMNVEAHRSLRQPAELLNIPDIWKELSFPWQAYRNDLGERLKVRSDISAEGEVTACHFAISLGDEVFREQICSTIKEHAHYTAAIGGDGQPLPSYHILSIAFVM